MTAPSRQLRQTSLVRGAAWQKDMRCSCSIRYWMYVVENGSIMNRSQFRKFGIKVAELVATMRKADVGLKEAA